MHEHTNKSPHIHLALNQSTYPPLSFSINYSVPFYSDLIPFSFSSPFPFLCFLLSLCFLETQETIEGEGEGEASQAKIYLVLKLFHRKPQSHLNLLFIIIFHIICCHVYVIHPSYFSCFLQTKKNKKGKILYLVPHSHSTVIN